MSNLRRYNPYGRPVFITSVTYNRQPFLSKNEDVLVESMKSIASRINIELVAWVILPEHIHLLLNAYNRNYAEIMHRIKLSFSTNYRKKHHLKSGRIWQLRYWDHIIRDEMDFNRHLDYIHYNPVKHGLINNPGLYPYSSIHKFADVYQSDWGVIEKPLFEGEFGE